MVTHLDSPRIEMSNQINTISGQLENTHRAMQTLTASVSILNSNVAANNAIISDIIQIQLRCIDLFRATSETSIDLLKERCKSAVTKAGELYWRYLSAISENIPMSHDQFMENWENKTIKHVILSGIEKKEDLDRYVQALREERQKLPPREELHLEDLHKEATLKKRYEEFEAIKKSLLEALDVNDVFQAAQAGDIGFIRQHEPKFLGMKTQKGMRKHVNQKDARGFSLLHIAAYAGRLEVVDYLLANGAEVEVSDREGDKPLHWAAAIGATEVAHRLLYYRADPNARGRRDMAPLHRSVFNNHLEISRLLLEYGANINARDTSDVTPIREAIGRNDFHSVRALLQYVKTVVDETDLKIAEAGRHPGIINMIRYRLGMPRLGVEEIPRIPNIEITQNQKLGEGSFAIVYRGTWNGREVAIKLLKNQADPDSDTGKYIREEMEAEALVMSRLEHQNIIPFHGVLQDRFGLVMDFISRGELFRLIPTRVKTEWTWQTILRFSKEMASGLGYLHSQKIVHRDFKSLNVLVKDDDVAVITDFGMSKIREYNMTMTVGAGSPAWMAPEQFKSEDYSYPVDIYALGMVMWEILETKVPFEDLNHPAQVMFRILKEKPGEKIDPARVPPAFAALLEKCWTEANSRPPAPEVLDALRLIEDKDLENFSRPLREV